MISFGGILSDFFEQDSVFDDARHLSLMSSIRSADEMSDFFNINPDIQEWINTINKIKEDVQRDYSLGLDCSYHYEQLVNKNIPDSALGHLIDIYVCVHETCSNEFLALVREYCSSCHIIDKNRLVSRIPPAIYTKLFPLDCFQANADNGRVIITNKETGATTRHTLFNTTNEIEIVRIECFRYCVVAYTRLAPYICYPYNKAGPNFSNGYALNHQCLFVCDKLTFTVRNNLLSTKVLLIVTDYDTCNNASINLTELVDKSFKVTLTTSIEITGANTTESTCTIRIDGTDYTWHYPVLERHHYLD